LLCSIGVLPVSGRNIVSKIFNGRKKMAKWADYRVIAVQYGSDFDSITNVKVKADYVDRTGDKETKTKSSVVR
jgi:hypothetical protein